MAKSLNWKKTITEQISAKGILNEDATVLTYIDDDKNEQTIKVQELLDKFASCGISISIKTQSDEQLDIEEPDEILIHELAPDYEDEDEE